MLEIDRTDRVLMNGTLLGKRASTSVSVMAAECNVDLPLCKYSYTSWCPTCERDPPRRRTKSETLESCRRKGREMKTLTPSKCNRHCEYENDIDMEYDLHEVHAVRCYERVRSNLCELPTTYITNNPNNANNCQLNLAHAKLSVTTDFLDAKSPRDYENTFALNSDCSPTATRETMSERHTRRSLVSGNVHAPATPKRAPHLQRAHGVTVVEPSFFINAHPTPHYNAASYRTTASPATTPTPTTPQRTSIRHDRDRLYDTHGHTHETCTFFDKHFDAKIVRERYTRELEILREKLKDLHNHKYSSIKPAATIKNLDKNAYKRNTTNINLDDIKVIEHVQTPKIDGIEKYRLPSSTSCRATTASAAAALVEKRRVMRVREQKSATKISVKTTKGRLMSARSSKLKLRSIRSSAMRCGLEDEESSSDNSDEDKAKTTVKQSYVPVRSPVHPNHIRRLTDTSTSPRPESNKSDEVIDIQAIALDATPATPSSLPSAVKPAPTKESGDAPLWPVRYSLFPNIPPYLKFSLHDDDPNKLPNGRRHLKWKLSTITPIVVRKTLVNTGFRLVRKSNDWSGTWGKHMKSPMFKTLKSNQKLNHFAGTFQLGRKDRLWKNVQRLMHRFGTKEFGFIPQTFVLPHDLKALKQCWECKDGSAGEKWIIKPPASARGVGIKVINKWSQLPKQGAVVVQKYIADPYLINGSKFDLRLYVLVTSFNPLRIYLYPEGLVRFASVKYSDNDRDLKDRFMHLTNYSINKLSSQYTANEDANSCQGHKWTLTKLWEYLSDRGIDTKYLWNSLKHLVIKTMVSAESPINQLCNEHVANRYNCYELFGVDVLFDERLKPWLLEVNISPSLHSTSPLDLHVKGPLVQTLFNLAQFHLPPKIGRHNESSPPCYDPRIYTTSLTLMEANKHNYFIQMDKRIDYLNEILDQLTGDDVRILTQAEDEYVVKGLFERIFPTANTYKFLDFNPVRYYNRLFDAWETCYAQHREEGIQRLKALCLKRVHLKVQPPPVVAKNSQPTIPGTVVPVPANTKINEERRHSQHPVVAPIPTAPRTKSPTPPKLMTSLSPAHPVMPSLMPYRLSANKTDVIVSSPPALK